MANHRSDMPGSGGRFLVPSLAVMAGVVLACAPARAQDFTMKFATQTLNDMQHEYIKVYKTELEKATNNRIKVEVYPASQLGGAQRQTEGLRLGDHRGRDRPGRAVRRRRPALRRCRRSPGSTRTGQHLQRCGRGPGIPPGDLRRRGRARHGRVESSTPMTCSRSCSRRRSPRSRISPASASACSRPMASRAPVAALGGSGVPMSLPEVLPALQQGTIDGVNSVLGVFVAFRYYDAAPNMVDTALWPILSVALVSKAWFDRLPPDLKKIVLETGSKIEPELLKWQITRIDTDTKAWTDKGGKIVKLAGGPGGGCAPRVGRGASRWWARALR